MCERLTTSGTEWVSAGASTGAGGIGRKLLPSCRGENSSLISRYLLPRNASCVLWILQNAFVVGGLGLPQTSLGKSQNFFRPTSWWGEGTLPLPQNPGRAVGLRPRVSALQALGCSLGDDYCSLGGDGRPWVSVSAQKCLMLRRGMSTSCCGSSHFLCTV